MTSIRPDALKRLQSAHPPYLFTYVGMENELLEQVQPIAKDECLILDGKHMANLDDFFREFSLKLGFPSYFGKNMNAFIDVMNDSTWFKRNDFIILIRNAEQLLKMPPDLQRDLPVILRDIAINWAIPLHEDPDWDHPSVPFKIILQAPERDTEDKLLENLKSTGVYYFDSLT